MRVRSGCQRTNTSLTLHQPAHSPRHATHIITGTRPDLRISERAAIRRAVTSGVRPRGVGFGRGSAEAKGRVQQGYKIGLCPPALRPSGAMPCPLRTSGRGMTSPRRGNANIHCGAGHRRVRRRHDQVAARQTITVALLLIISPFTPPYLRNNMHSP